MSSNPGRRDDFDIELKLLVEAIYQRYHYDFRGYAVASLKRRMHAAMAHFGCGTLSQLQDRVLHEPALFPALLDYLTVQVSEMFRDPGYFRALRQEVVPLLRTYPSLKVWVAGCSTGEEAWSLAILLREEGLLSRSLIYATDINPQALQAAEAGIYSVERIPDFTENHRRAGGARARCRTTTPRPTAARCSTSRCASTSSFPTTAWPPTACSPKCSWCRAATC